jgi:hypothetical protein
MSSSFRPSANSPNVVITPATCETAERRAYFDEAGVGDCYGPGGFDAEQHCPPGFILDGNVFGEHGCNLTRQLPICKRNTFPANAFDCCLENNNGSNPACAPNLCTSKSNEPACFNAFRDACLTTPNQMANPKCQEFARRSEQRGKAAVFDAVQRYCKTTRLGRVDPFCACINADDPNLCTSATNCFARLFPNQLEQAVCFAPECVGNSRPRQAFIPVKEGGCANICAPQIAAISQGRINVGESLNQITLCGDQITPEDLQRIQSALGFTTEEILASRTAFQNGNLDEAARISAAAQERLKDTPAGQIPPSSAAPDSGAPSSSSSSGLPQSAIIALSVLGGLLVLGLIAWLVTWLVMRNQKKAEAAATKEAKENEGEGVFTTRGVSSNTNRRISSSSRNQRSFL